MEVQWSTNRRQDCKLVLEPRITEVEIDQAADGSDLLDAQILENVGRSVALGA